MCKTVQKSLDKGFKVGQMASTKSLICHSRPYTRDQIESGLVFNPQKQNELY